MYVMTQNWSMSAEALHFRISELGYGPTLTNTVDLFVIGISKSS